MTTTTLFSEGWSSLTINHNTFEVLQESYDEYGSKGKTVTFYKKESNETKQTLFSFVLEDTTGGCNDKSLERGAYEVNGTNLTFYTLWKRRGSVDDAPLGGRVIRYEVLKNGEFHRLSSQLYVEEYRRDFNSKSGMKFLFETPKTEENKELLAKYVASVEKRYDGQFVFDDASNKLIKEVRKALKRKMRKIWGNRRR